MHALWWLQSAKITTGSSILLARAHTFFSMLDPAPMTILLVHARSFTHKQNKCIYFRQHHMFMNIRRIRKKRKYLIIKLTCACSSDWSNMCTWWGCGCNISRDVLIIACKVEREVQDRQAATRPNFSAGRNTSWTSRGPSTYTRPAAPPSTTAAHSYREPPKQPPPPFKGAQSGPAASSSSSMASTGQTRDRDIKCRRCQGGVHFAKDCPSKRVMTITADGGYESASDYDEETLVLIANEEQGAHDDAHDMEYMAPDDADKYASLVAQRVLSVQVTKAEQNQRHNLFHTKGVVKERSVRIIIDGGSCNNLASMELVEKLSLTWLPY